MANNEERSQQEQARQSMYDNAHPHSVTGRPRARGVQGAGGRQPRRAQQVQAQQQAQQTPPPRRQTYQQPRPAQQPQQLFEEEYEPQPQPRQQAAPSQQAQRRGRGRSFEQAAYSGATQTRTRAAAQVREKPPKGKSNAVTWLLVLLVLALLAAAGYLVFLLFNGGLGNLSLPGTKPAQKALPEGGVLVETADAGDSYVAQTIFVGDSNFERLREYGLVDAGTVAAKVGIGAGGITTDPFIEVTGQDSPLTIAQTMAAIGPNRILVMMGTNDVPTMTADEFAATYKAALAELRKSAPNADIVVAAIPPVANWKDSEMLNASAVRQFNEALLALCKEEGYPYLDTYAALADGNGYLPEAYTDDGYHLTQQALDVLLQYYRTHAYNP